MTSYRITVTRVGTPEIVEESRFKAESDNAAERKMGDLWSKSRYDQQPDRFRARLWKGEDDELIMTIG